MGEGQREVEFATSLKDDAGMAGMVPLLISIAKSTRQLMSLKLAEIDVLAGQDQLLDVLEESRANNIVEIASVLSVRPSTVSKMLDVFEQRGLAVREADRLDKRKVFVRLTTDGSRVQKQVRETWRKLEEELAKSFDQDVEDALVRSLQQINTMLVSRLSRLR